MPAIREQTVILSDAGKVAVTQNGKVIDLRNPRGRIRMSIATVE